MEHTVYSAAYLILVLFFPIAIYHRLQAARTREPIDRRHEGWVLLIGIRLVALLTAGAVVKGFRRPPALAEIWQWAGVALLALAAAWLAWMFISLGRNLTDTVVTRKNSHFVSHGPYRYVRNPMYIGVLALGLALAILQGFWPVALGATVVFTLLAIRTRIEERFLLARFGQTYQDYMAKVGRFVPIVK